jgi:hypothetical protein
LSQIYKRETAGQQPPQVPTSITADEGSAVPDNNILIISADDISENNFNGIVAKAGAGETGGDGNPLESNEVQIQLTNRLVGTVTSTDDSGDILISFTVDTSDNNVYTIDLDISAVSVLAGPVTEGAAFKLWAGVVTDGSAATASLLGVDTSANFKTAAMTTVGVSATIVGSALNILVTGLASDNVFWRGTGYYTQVTD